MGSFAFVGSDARLLMFFKMLGVDCFNSIEEVDYKTYKVALVEEELFKKINLHNYLGVMVIIPFRSTDKKLSNEKWLTNLITGEFYHEENY